MRPRWWEGEREGQGRDYDKGRRYQVGGRWRCISARKSAESGAQFAVLSSDWLDNVGVS